MAIEIGDNTKGTIVKILDFGAIVRLEGGSTGLIHISEIADAYVRDVREYVQENDEVTVKVLRPGKQGRFDLSLKQCKPDPVTNDFKREVVSVGTPTRSEEARSADPRHAPPQMSNFEDVLSRFLKDSQERQHELKRHLDTKRGRK